MKFPVSSTIGLNARGFTLDGINQSAEMMIEFDFLVPPLSIEILCGHVELSAGKSYNFTCKVTGSRPSPVITWWQGNIQLPGGTSQVNE